MFFLVFNHGLPQARDPTVPGRSKGNALPDTGVSARLAHRKERAPNGLVITGVDRFDRVGRANGVAGLGVVLRGMAGACAHDDFDSCTIVELGRRLTGAHTFVFGRDPRTGPSRPAWRDLARSRRDASRRHKRGPLRIRHDALPTTVCRPMMLDPSLIGPFGAVADCDQRISAP